MLTVTRGLSGKVSQSEKNKMFKLQRLYLCLVPIIWISTNRNFLLLGSIPFQMSSPVHSSASWRFLLARLSLHIYPNTEIKHVPPHGLLFPSCCFYSPSHPDEKLCSPVPPFSMYPLPLCSKVVLPPKYFSHPFLLLYPYCHGLSLDPQNFSLGFL